MSNRTTTPDRYHGQYQTKKVLKGKIVPASVIESKNKPSKFTINCVKKLVEKRLKALSPLNCFPPSESNAMHKKSGKNARKNSSDRKFSEIYESEFDNVELKAFTSSKEDGFHLPEAESFEESAIGLDVNNHIVSYRSLHSPLKASPQPVAKAPRTPPTTFALLFGSDNQFEENQPSSTQLSSSISRSVTSSFSSTKHTHDQRWALPVSDRDFLEPSSTFDGVEYVDEEELSRSIQFSLDTSTNSRLSAHSPSPYQNIHYHQSNSNRRSQHAARSHHNHNHHPKPADTRLILENVRQLVRITTDYFDTDDEAEAAKANNNQAEIATTHLCSNHLPGSSDYAHSRTTATNSCHVSSKSLTSSTASASSASRLSSDSIEFTTDLSECSLDCQRFLLARHETDEWICTSF